jgi:hypothetical protein
LSRSARLPLEELLRFHLDPREQWELAWSGPPLPLGTVREVFRTRRPQTSGNSGFDPARVRVGAIRVTVAGSSITVSDADRDITIARIDAEAFGIPPETLAAIINSEGELGQVLGGVAISNGMARAFTPPADF